MKSLKKNKITQFTRKISEAARFFGADIVGIASVERFEKAPKGFHPKDLMSNAKSVLVMGKYFPLGVLKGNSKAAVTRVYETLFIALDQCAYRLSTLIENQGGQALPIPADVPYYSWDKRKQCGRGDLSHRHAAVLAGLGSLGKNSLLLTPDFGNRVNLTSVLTNVPLVENPPFGRDLCISGCDLCLRSCPANALRGDGTVIQKECRKLHSITTGRGFRLFACWECRRVCPAQGNLLPKTNAKE
jgi:epoxyqueuosine reductase QueG